MGHVLLNCSCICGKLYHWKIDQSYVCTSNGPRTALKLLGNGLVRHFSKVYRQEKGFKHDHEMLYVYTTNTVLTVCSCLTSHYPKLIVWLEMKIVWRASRLVTSDSRLFIYQITRHFGWSALQSNLSFGLFLKLHVYGLTRIKLLKIFLMLDV